MATSNHPKNQQPHGLGNLVQIDQQSKTVREIAIERGDSEHDIADLEQAFIDMGASIDDVPVSGDGRTLIEIEASATECLKELNGWNVKATAHNPKPWVIVENLGTEFADIVIDFATFREAARWIERNYTDDNCPADIMRRRDDGVLTTEY